MLIIGTIEDLVQAKQISKELNKHEIHHELEVGPPHRLLTSENLHPVKINHAQEIFLVMTGQYRAPVKIDKKWEKIHQVPLGKVSLVLIVISVLCFFAFQTNPKTDWLLGLYFSEIPDGGFEKIASGQYWRIFTPMFLHFSVLHILCNSLWMKTLGSVIEKTKGPVYFIVMTLVLAGTSNLGQFLAKGPNFGGLSGVVFGLFGWVSARAWVKPEFPMGLPKNDMVIIAIYFVLCWTGMFGPIANVAHGVGLGLGIVFGGALLDSKPTKAAASILVGSGIALGSYYIQMRLN